LCGDHEIEDGVFGDPVLEPDHFDPNIGEAGEVPPRNSREPLAGLEAGHSITASGERERGLARPATDLEDVAALGDTGERDHVFEEPLRVAGAKAVIQLGNLIERLSTLFERAHQGLALPVSHSVPHGRSPDSTLTARSADVQHSAPSMLTL
jgi:hypothetical protein